MQYGIELRICVAILIELIKSNMISKPDARQRLEMLIEKRGWEGGVLEVLVKRYLEDEPFVE
jgi:hypothetical protein